ncbi:NAD(P)/FAD-dependent oxidoreductase [Bacillus sp. DJP31]|uniref:NAD(P)/FAD-dependent oxidoreductase n=1 Tax=Bacillus sp. DJP31 TaxID=3409789 RepID=UPI003BB7D591
MKKFQCIIVGGGIAGLQAAIQLGRYQHQVAVIDKGYGRSTLCRCYHNVLGWPDGIDGNKLRNLGREHAEKYGVTFLKDEIVTARKTSKGLLLKGSSAFQYECQYLLMATGVSDRIPIQIPNLKECLGLTIYLCPDCDGYEVMNRRVIVLGSGDVGANMALTLTHWTTEIIYINHETIEINEDLNQQLKKKDIKVFTEEVEKVLIDSLSNFTGVTLTTGQEISGDRGFLAFGGTKINTDLLRQLGVERLENHHIMADPRSKETNVPNVWVAGDIVAHSEQLTIAMGEGSQAAIWMHKRILQQ